MTRLALALLGSFDATVHGRPADGLNSERLRALLAYLAVENREHPREHMAALLWPERPDQEALSSLRFAVSNLRGALGDRQSSGDPQSPVPFLLVTRSHVQFNPASDHWLDVAEFQDLSGRSDVPSLERAAALYRGPFLAGLSVGDSPAFEEWMLLKGEEFARTALSALNRLTALQLDRAATVEASRWARRQLELEPYREQAHRQLMTALALGGDRSAALAHYEVCRRLLARELGCEPEDETQALHAQIRSGALPQAPPARATLVEPARPVSTGTGAGAAAAVPAARFVGRAGEIARLGSLLDQALAGRGGVALISGEPGGGKTALLDEFAGREAVAHTDLIALRGRCNAYAGVGDLFLPFREILQTLAGDIESKRAGGTLSPEQARRAWEALPAMVASLVEHGPDLIDTFVPGDALLRRLEAFATPAAAKRWQPRLRETVARAKDRAATSQPDLFAQVTRVLHTLSERCPLLLALDDLQWADGGTLALLFHLGRRLAGSRILLLAAYRPPGAGPGQEHEAASAIGPVLEEMAREWGDVVVDLDRADGRAFVEAYVDCEPNRLEPAFRQRLYAHTGGNPLFTAELLRSFERQGMLRQDEAGCWVEAPGLDWDYCPPQVEAVIAAHLAGLPDADQALLQAAAVQGERFSAEVVARVLGRAEEAVVQRLSGPLGARQRLVSAVSVERLPSTGQRLSHYHFRHALFQRSAYGSADAAWRLRLHEATGRALEAIYATEEERPQSLAPALARHYEAAGLRLAAARALDEAGRQAVRLSAFREALDLFDRGLALLAAEPRTAQRDAAERREVERLLQVDRLVPERSLGSSGSKELENSLARVIEAGAEGAEERTRLVTLSAEADHLVAKGRFDELLGVAGRMLDLATRCGDEGYAAFAHFWFGFSYNLMGLPLQAERHFEWILERQAPGRWTDMRAALGYDILPHTLTFSAINNWFLGHPEAAHRHSARALISARELGDIYGLAFASAIGCMTLFLLRADTSALDERSDFARRHCLEHGFAWWQHYAEVFGGWLAVVRGEDRGIESIQAALLAWKDTGMVVGTDPLIVVLADAYLVAASRRPPDDNAERAQLLAIGLETVEQWIGPDVACGQAYQAELYRLRGELLLARDGLDAIEEVLACFQQALALGREKGALAWQLRAGMSIVRLRARMCAERAFAERQGEACAAELAKARECLAEVYGKFTEGLAFPDLQDATALIGAGEETLR